MRLVALVAVAVTAGLIPCVAFGQEVAEGERVVTVRDAPLRSGNDTTGTVPMGNILDVKHVNGEWYWVTWTLHKTAKGWINRADVVGFYPALEYFNEEIKREPTARAYNARGVAYFGRGDLDLALADFNQAIKLDPKMAAAFDNRGLTWGRKKEYQKAIADYDQAIKLDPKLVSAWNDRAWEEATAIEAKTRDGKKAVQDSKKALELAGSSDDPTLLTTLAAAYATAGDFESAVKWQTRAVQLAPSAEQRTDWQSRLDLYRGRQAYQEY
jgi:tetratricopeptide (TPR) repeat protein